MLASHPKLALALATGLFIAAGAMWFHVPAAIMAGNMGRVLALLGATGFTAGTAIYATSRAVWGFIIKGVE